MTLELSSYLLLLPHLGHSADTAFSLTATQLTHLPPIFMPHAGGQGLHEITRHHFHHYARGSMAKHIPSGSSGLCSTLHDYGRFCSMLLGGGAIDGVRVLAPRSVGLLRANHLGQDVRAKSRPQISELPPSGTGFGLGVSVLTDPVCAKVQGCKDLFV